MKNNIWTILIPVCFSIKTYSQECVPENVINSKIEPFKYICYLKKIKPSGTSYTSTAFLISPRVLLTNAHNLYNASRFEISPAHNGQGIKVIQGDTSLTFGMISLNRTSENTIYNENFIINQRKRTKKKARHFDYGIIILPDNAIYDMVGGFLQLAESDKVAKVGDSILFAGYPGGIRHYNLELFQKYNTGIINGYYENGEMISYKLGTHKGASGSPIIITQNNNYKIIGIHGYGSGCKNSAIKITQEIITEISNWTSKIY